MHFISFEISTKNTRAEPKGVRAHMDDWVHMQVSLHVGWQLDMNYTIIAGGYLKAIKMLHDV